MRFLTQPGLKPAALGLLDCGAGQNDLMVSLLVLAMLVFNHTFLNVATLKRLNKGYYIFIWLTHIWFTQRQYRCYLNHNDTCSVLLWQSDTACCCTNICHDEQNCWVIWHSVRAFISGSFGANRCVPNKGLRVLRLLSKKEWLDCSGILADPRCVPNIKSSAVIPLAAPNTNRGLLVAMATSLLPNVASSKLR